MLGSLLCLLKKALTATLHYPWSSYILYCSVSEDPFFFQTVYKYMYFDTRGWKKFVTEKIIFFCHDIVPHQLLVMILFRVQTFFCWIENFKRDFILSLSCCSTRLIVFSCSHAGHCYLLNKCLPWKQGLLETWAAVQLLCWWYTSV